ncbi:MAG: hypothetical protein ABR905_17615 [Terracidiphilus sp.]|jgi:hypothetical protein
MTENSSQHLYTPQALAACEKALCTILTKVGPWGSRLILIGGMTPRYLVGNAPMDMKEHVGTTDLDIVVGVTVSTEEEEAYRTLQQNLKEAGFAPAVNPDTGTEETFRWVRDVDGTRVLLEFFCPVGDGQPGRLYRNPGHNIGSKISAIRTQGAELAGIDHFSVTLKGETLDDGGIQEGVTARVANLLPFVVLKAFAIEQRDKDKDSYDLVWTLNAFSGGPLSAVEAMAVSPVLNHPEIPIAVGYLRKNFQTVEHRGPAQYARFERSNGTEDERTSLRRFAQGTIAQFLAHWEALALPFK